MWGHWATTAGGVDCCFPRTARATTKTKQKNKSNNNNNNKRQQLQLSFGVNHFAIINKRSKERKRCPAGSKDSQCSRATSDPNFFLPSSIVIIMIIIVIVMIMIIMLQQKLHRHCQQLLPDHIRLLASKFDGLTNLPSHNLFIRMWQKCLSFVFFLVWYEVLPSCISGKRW